jgi:hypothetical protein
LNEEAGRDREGDNKKAAGDVTFIDYVAMCLNGRVAIKKSS